MHDLMEIFEDSPVIAAVKDEGGLKKCLQSDIRIVFVLYGTVCSIADIVDRLLMGGKSAIVHVDLIEGLAAKEVAADFIQMYTKASGIISTKPALIRRAKELGMFSVLRVFVIDSIALQNVKRGWNGIHPDMIEILPGIMPKTIRELSREITVPVIAGGLIQEKEDIINALSAGALGVSATDPAVWFL